VTEELEKARAAQGLKDTISELEGKIVAQEKQTRLA